MNDRSQEICAGAMSARFWPTTVMHVSLLALTRQLALGPIRRAQRKGQIHYAGSAEFHAVARWRTGPVRWHVRRCLLCTAPRVRPGLSSIRTDDKHCGHRQQSICG